jgi:hypothetical protein
VNKLILIPILFGVVIIPALFLFSETPSSPTSESIYESGFTFYDVEKIESTLSLQNISMSTPIAITDHTIGQYCIYFDDEIQKNIQYCTTTAILNSDGVSIGNINMGGTIDGPIMALAILDTSDIISSENEVDFVFQTMIETLVCTCWDEKQPGDFESIGAWLNTAKIKYIESSKTTLKSKIDGLAGMNLILEITSKDDSYLWTLIILK